MFFMLEWEWVKDSLNFSTSSLSSFGFGHDRIIDMCSRFLTDMSSPGFGACNKLPFKIKKVRFLFRVRQYPYGFFKLCRYYYVFGSNFPCFWLLRSKIAGQKELAKNSKVLPRGSHVRSGILRKRHSFRSQVGNHPSLLPPPPLFPLYALLVGPWFPFASYY